MVPLCPMTTSITVTPGEIDNAALLAIARIIRGCAELEDMLTLFACKLTGLKRSARAGHDRGLTVERRLEVVGRLAEIYSPAAHTAFQHCFDANFAS